MILVTGAAGFIGFHLIQRLLKEGESILCIDNLNNYYDPQLKSARLDIIRDRIHFYNTDISSFSDLEDVFKNHDISAIFHLAAQAGVRYSIENPHVYISSNYTGTFNILELARKYTIPKLIIASTSSVYGKSTALPFTESDEASSPASLYAATKRGCEILGSNYHLLHGLNICFLRFFTVYGPWGRPDMALFKFTQNILGDKPIEVYNNGDMWRDFTYIDDIVDGFTASWRFLEVEGGFHIFNLGRGEPVRLMDFISMLENILGTKAQKQFLPMQPGDMYKTWANISKAQTRLKYFPKINIEKGIENFVYWYKELYYK